VPTLTQLNPGLGSVVGLNAAPTAANAAQLAADSGSQYNAPVLITSLTPQQVNSDLTGINSTGITNRGAAAVAQGAYPAAWDSFVSGASASNPVGTTGGTIGVPLSWAQPTGYGTSLNPNANSTGATTGTTTGPTPKA
jgi:hypothetical protein